MRLEVWGKKGALYTGMPKPPRSLPGNLRSAWGAVADDRPSAIGGSTTVRGFLGALEAEQCGPTRDPKLIRFRGVSLSAFNEFDVGRPTDTEMCGEP